MVDRHRACDILCDGVDGELEPVGGSLPGVLGVFGAKALDLDAEQRFKQDVKSSSHVSSKTCKWYDRKT